MRLSLATNNQAHINHCHFGGHMMTSRFGVLSGWFFFPFFFLIYDTAVTIDNHPRIRIRYKWLHKTVRCFTTNTPLLLWCCHVICCKQQQTPKCNLRVRVKTQDRSKKPIWSQKSLIWITVTKTESRDQTLNSKQCNSPVIKKKQSKLRIYFREVFINP